MDNERFKKIYEAAHGKMEEAKKDPSSLKQVRNPINIYAPNGAVTLVAITDRDTRVEAFAGDVYSIVDNSFKIKTGAHQLKDLKHAEKMRRKWKRDHDRMNAEMDAANARMGRSYY